MLLYLSRIFHYDCRMFAFKILFISHLVFTSDFSNGFMGVRELILFFVRSVFFINLRCLLAVLYCHCHVSLRWMYCSSKLIISRSMWKKRRDLFDAFWLCLYIRWVFFSSGCFVVFFVWVFLSLKISIQNISLYQKEIFFRLFSTIHICFFFLDLIRKNSSWSNSNFPF